MKKYQAYKELKHRVYVRVLSRTAKRVSIFYAFTERIAKTLIRLIFVKRNVSLQSSYFIFEFGSQSGPSIQGRHQRYVRFGFGGTNFFGQKWF